MNAILENTVNGFPLINYPDTRVNEDFCPICLSDYVGGSLLKELPCGHHFHTNCVSAWLHDKTSCPLCRHDFNRIRQGASPR